MAQVVVTASRRGSCHFLILFLLWSLQWGLWQHKCSAKSYLWVFFASVARSCHRNGHWLSVLYYHHKFLGSFKKKKRKKYNHPINIFMAESITATYKAHIRSFFSSHTTISCWLHWELHLHSGCMVRLLIMQTHLVLLSSAQIQMDMPSWK